MVMADEYEDIIENVETLVEDDDKFPVIKNNNIKTCCMMALELTKVFLNYMKCNIKKNGIKKEN